MNGRKALIYEDDQAALDQLAGVFSGLGIEAVTGPDPAAILDAVRDVAPDMIFLSADLKGSFSACLKIKKDKNFRRIPLFMIAGRTPADVLSKHQRLPTRADVYLPTPLSSVMLTEILREQIPAMPPQAQQRTESSPEIPVDDAADRTIVSTRGFEASVVNFVEDEVGGLRETVARLQNERDDLHGKIGELETLLRNQSEVFDSGIRAIREHQETIERSSRSEVSKVEDMNRLLDDAVREAVAEAVRQAQAAAAESRSSLEADLQDARARIADLKEIADESSRQRKQIGKLEKALEDARRREAEARAEMEETGALFARLEGGYKESLEALEEERDSLRERVYETENEIEGLHADIRGFREMADRFPALQEAAARNEVLAEENRRQAEAVEKLQAQVAALEAAEQTAHNLAGEVVKLRASEKAVRQQLADLRTRFNQVRAAMGLPNIDGEATPDGEAGARGRSE